MREGLRSSVKLLAKTDDSESSPCQATVKMDVDSTEEKGFNSSNGKSPKVIGSLTEEDKLASAPKEEAEMNQTDGSTCGDCGAWSDTDEDITDDRRKRNRINYEGECEDDSVKKLKVKDDAVDGKLQVVGRILRSGCTVKSGGGKKAEGGQSNDGFVGNLNRRDVFEDNGVKVQKEDTVHFDIRDSYLSGNMMRKKIVYKRGRPPKSLKSKFQQKWGDVAKEAIEQSAGRASVKKLKRKRGRPPKVLENYESEKWGGMEKEMIGLSASQASCQKKNKEIENLKPRRGRPPKAQGSDLSEKRRDALEEEEVNKSAGRESNQPNNEARKKNLKRKRGRPPKVRDNYELLPAKEINCSDDDKEEGKTKKKAEKMSRRRLQRQTVRDKIVELLLGAGWEIQYRPRNGREYKDAVYVNPEGRTHWSVTLAYHVLKKQYEDSEGNSNTSKSGFKFTPVPEEELSILTKVMTKERSDKNKKKKKWNQEKGEKTTEIVTERKKWKLHKRKLGAVPGVNFKKLKRRTKLKTMHRRENDSTCTTAQGAAVSVRDHKRLEAHCRKRCALMVRNSQDGIQSETDGYVLYDGKQTVLAWMIGLGTVQLEEEVHYLKRRKTRAVLRGRITTDGIQCDCCSKTFTIAEFEAHAGGKSCQPFKNIYLETGASLFQCQLDSWNKQDESSRKGFHFVDIDGEDPNDDTCGICGDGGDLICCDGCPSTFHQSCLGIKKFPSGLWHCMFCLCKFCGMACGNMRQRDDDNASPLLALLTCCFCEEKYHRSCAQVKDTMSDDPDSSSFCGKKCQELYKRLHRLFGVKHDLDEGFSWTFLRRFDVGPDVSLSGMPQKVECNSKLAVALHIMDECFLPMVDHRSGVNLIHNIVYNFGSNFNRLNYSGFFTAILERGDEIIAAASIRIHGNHLAEMPFIGTRYMYRRQGMCRRLLSAIEMALCSLNIEKLVIPAVSELRETWTSVFGFKPLEGMSKKILRNMNMLVFPGVDMLQKPLLNHQFPGENMNPIEGLESTESGKVHTTENMTNNFVGRSSAEFDLKVSIETGIPHSCGMINELAAIEPVSLLTDGCLNDTSEVAIRSANTTECRELGVNSDNLDGRIENIVKSHDAANDKQCGNEMVNNSDERYPGGFDLEDCSENSLPHSSNIIGESALVESVSLLPDGCLNDTSDVTTRSANPTKCHESGLTSGNPDKRNESNVKPHDSSHNTDEQMGNKMISNSDGRSSTGFDFKGSNYASNMIGELAAFEHDSVFLDGCLNDTSISIQGVNNTKCQVQQRVTSDILDGESKNIMNPLDSLCKVCKESEGEMINNSNGSDSAGFDLKSSSETNVIGEPAAAESVGLPDGCLNEASDLIIQERNKITCHDQSGTVSHNLDGINENIGSCPDSLCDAYEQVAKVAGQQNSLSASIIPPTDNALQELHVQLNNASEVGIQFSAESLIGSEAASHLGEFPRASSGGAENVSCEVKIEVSNVEHNPDSVGEDSMHMTAQIISSQSQDLATEYGVNVSDENAVLHESDTGVISCDGVKSTSSEACPRAQDALNVFFPALPVEQNFNSCQRNGPDGQETEIVAMDNVMASDVIVKPNSHGCMNNAICMSREVASSSCGDGVYGLKDMSATTQSDAISLDGVLISGKAHVNNKLLKPPGSGSELDCASVTQSNSESMCSSSSASGVALHCASGGINSCSAPDVIMLSNQAN